MVARVDGQAITLSDTREALGLGLVDVRRGEDPTAAAIHQLIERRLVLAEVARFAPAEPDRAVIDRELASLKAHAGSSAQLDALMKSTGLDEERLRGIARDNLRIQAYLNQRFGVTVQAGEDEVVQYYRAHPEEFRRGAELIPFEQAEPAARQRASAERRNAIIAQWLRDLRQRADVVELYKK